MQRSAFLETIRERTAPWDIVIIGGGATGAGCALDAASRGLSVLLLEQDDFGKGTSSRSTKLIHGGVRYLRQGNISLVREALKERSILLKNAPHVVHTQAFVIPCYSLWQKVFYGIGMKLYDLLAGKHRIGTSRLLSRSETVEHLSSIKARGLVGGVLYHDGQFDDTRLLIYILRTAVSHGAAVLNYSRVETIDADKNGRIKYVGFTDALTGEKHRVATRAVINAAGIFSDEVRRMQDKSAARHLSFSQGIHLVFDRKFLPSNDALMIPKTPDGRVLFCIPWHEHLLVGTTDTPVDGPNLEPMALNNEIDFILETAGAYLENIPKCSDILSVFAGIRPLISSDENRKTSSLSRGHELFVDASGLITITGGKWTTYRQMAEDAVDKAIEIGGMDSSPCRTEDLAIELPQQIGDSGKRLHPALPYTREDVIRAVRDEMACTVEDVLARRTRALFLNANAAVEMAPKVASIMADEMGFGNVWINAQIERFDRASASYRREPQ
ncbi:MAG: glycerol-3-phosphate dehydrogenase/oxidase [Acidobacteria bacterium]|nr:glycerol-3-phosphate dehydrogenase/oxidase [Acidobacteriota bacterium]